MSEDNPSCGPKLMVLWSVLSVAELRALRRFPSGRRAPAPPAEWNSERPESWQRGLRRRCRFSDRSRCHNRSPVRRPVRRGRSLRQARHRQHPEPFCLSPDRRRQTVCTGMRKKSCGFIRAHPYTIWSSAVMWPGRMGHCTICRITR